MGVFMVKVPLDLRNYLDGLSEGPIDVLRIPSEEIAFYLIISGDYVHNFGQLVGWIKIWKKLTVENLFDDFW